jgi:hypothetical protein
MYVCLLYGLLEHINLVLYWCCILFINTCMFVFCMYGLLEHRNLYNISTTQDFYVLTNHTKDKHTCINEQYTTSVQHKIYMFQTNHTDDLTVQHKVFYVKNTKTHILLAKVFLDKIFISWFTYFVHSMSVYYDECLYLVCLYVITECQEICLYHC